MTIIISNVFILKLPLLIKFYVGWHGVKYPDDKYRILSSKYLLTHPLCDGSWLQRRYWVVLYTSVTSAKMPEVVLVSK